MIFFVLVYCMLRVLLVYASIVSFVSLMKILPSVLYTCPGSHLPPVVSLRCLIYLLFMTASALIFDLWTVHFLIKLKISYKDDISYF